MSEVTILRGIVGAGKSTFARKYKSLCESVGMSVMICSADDFFIDQNGVYRWYVSGIADAHSYCRSNFAQALRDKVQCIIVDNTNTMKREFDYYVTEAKKYEAEVTIITVGFVNDKAAEFYASRNTHGVPLDKVLEMARRFEV